MCINYQEHISQLVQFQVLDTTKTLEIGIALQVLDEKLSYNNRNDDDDKP
jgi:hypothetical protein